MGEIYRCPFSKSKILLSTFLVISGASDNQQVLAVAAGKHAVVWWYGIHRAAAGLIQLHFDGSLAVDNHIGSWSVCVQL